MKKHYFSLLLLSLFVTTIFSQYKEQKIDSSFIKHTSDYQEVVYAHVNKSKFIKGEMLGFTAYVFDKKAKKLSNLTKNLYCTISDEKDSIVASKLFKVENGIVDGYFMINDSIKSGKYTFRSYTNWMRNFPQNNYHTEEIQIIDAETVFTTKKQERDFNIDVQFLPESGHLLDGVVNVMGVIVKDTLGFGVSNVSGKIYDDKDNYITDFKVNDLGIGRFSFTPNYQRIYRAEINNRNKITSIPIAEQIHKNGVLLHVYRDVENVYVSLKPNLSSNETKNDYTLTFHNGSEIRELDVVVNGSEPIIKKIPNQELTSGIVVFTLFDSQNNPIAERLFFNYENINVLKSTNVISNKDQDSTAVALGFNRKDLGANNVSVSILPSTTSAYEKNTNILSKVFLEPYLKGTIQNADYYFKDINKEKIQDLDNLLITQGWSSYSWKNIFREENNRIYQFENGIDVKVNIPSTKAEKESTYLIQYSSKKQPDIIEFKEKIKSFSTNGTFPFDGDILSISKIKENGTLLYPSLYAQFSINQVPQLYTNYNEIPLQNVYYESENFTDFSLFQNLNKEEVLNEVVIKANKEKSRQEKIRNNASGRVFFVNNTQRNYLLSFYLSYLPNLAAFDNHNTGKLDVRTRSTRIVPAIFLDGFQVLDLNMLYMYPMLFVDYVEVDLFEMGVGFPMTYGSVKIKTDYSIQSPYIKTLNTTKFPITFTKPKKFYVPKYETTNNELFKRFGVIDWKPTASIDTNGILNLKFDSKDQKEVKLFIEGVTENGEFIFEEKTISLN